MMHLYFYFCNVYIFYLLSTEDWRKHETASIEKKRLLFFLIKNIKNYVHFLQIKDDKHGY